MENYIIFLLVLMLVGGLACGRLVKKVKLPNVTGYLIAGLILGPSLLNWISADMVSGFSIVSDMALAFIAFSVGGGFSLSYFKKVGKAPIIIAIAESFGAIILVAVVCIVCGFDAKLSIMLGAIAAATAPAQTIMVINQYKAKGALTSMLLSVVAIDDAVALIAFGFATTVVQMMSTSNVNVMLSILSPLYQVAVSVVIGGAVALLLKLVLRYFKKKSNRQCILLAAVLGAYYLASLLQGSALLACMAVGAVITNITTEAGSLLEIADTFTPAIFMIFFVISGAGFEVSALPSIGLMGVLYLVVRVIGKMLGAWAGGRLTHQESKICTYLGPTLMPQAGVALGLVVAAGAVVPAYAPQIRTVILCSTFIYSIIGPSVAKWALQKAGEIQKGV